MRQRLLSQESLAKALDINQAAVSKMERRTDRYISTLRAERGRRKEAAERLGISPRTLRYKLAQMRDAGMDVEAYLFATP